MQTSTVEGVVAEPVADPPVSEPEMIEPQQVAQSLPTPMPCMACVPNLEGRWSGYWESDETGHTGPLRARVEKIDSFHYRVVFCGRFWKVVPFRYGSELAVTGKGHGVVCLGGSERLGPIMGDFSYNARATNNQIVLCYKSRKDHGRFVMCRAE